MIDKNRGILKRTTPGGIAVVMYKDEPGVYYDSTGGLLEEKHADEAGFDVSKLRLERRRRELMAEAQKRIDQQIAEEAGKVEETLAREAESEAERQVVEESRPAYRAEKKGRFWVVLDREGNEIESRIGSKDDADAVVAQLVQDEQDAAAP